MMRGGNRKAKGKMDIHIRWMIRKDMPEVLAIEDEAFEFPWPEEEFIKVLRQRNCIGMVAEYDEQVVSHMMYAIHPNRLELLSLAVKKKWRREQIGSRMIDKLLSKLHGKRNKIQTLVRETNLPALLFLKSNRFLATDLRRNYYDEMREEDAIEMTFQLRERAKV